MEGEGARVTVTFRCEVEVIIVPTFDCIAVLCETPERVEGEGGEEDAGGCC